MVTLRDRRKQRLQSDYQEMCNLRGSVIDWEATRGQAPHVEEYRLTVKVRSVISDQPSYRQSHVIRLTLPRDYPQISAAPVVQMETKPYVFHPNWYRDGRYCHGGWIPSEGLGDFVVRMVKTLQYNREITNENSAANSEAKQWYLKHKTSSLFPCDQSALPDPTASRFKVRQTEEKPFRPRE